MLAMRLATGGTPADTQKPMTAARVQPSTRIASVREIGWKVRVTRVVVMVTRMKAAVSAPRLAASVVSTTAVEASDAPASCVTAEMADCPGLTRGREVMSTMSASPVT